MTKRKTIGETQWDAVVPRKEETKAVSKKTTALQEPVKLSLIHISEPTRPY